MAKIIVVKGTSGTGKGTRVVQFIEWLRTKLEPTELTYTIGDKTRPFGLKFEELKLIFVGQYTVSNKSGLASWTSMDAIHAATGSGDIARDLVKGWLAQGYTLVCEGEPLMLSDKWRPEWMFKNYPIESLALLYFAYPDRYQYDARIRGRSGKEAGDSGWSRNESYSKEFEKSKAEMLVLGWEVVVNDYSGQDVLYRQSSTNTQEFKTGNDSELAMMPFDAPLWVIGNAIHHQMRGEFHAMGLDIKDFYGFCETDPMTREVGGDDPLAHRVPEKATKSKTKASAKGEVTKSSVSLLGLLSKG
ncbi:hypothetical protein [Salmonella phage SP1]|uniref:Uncharacterized protein n=1 Tax=Salmonella phage SP1 TaxID=2025818 RepID=A0A249Y0L7_9CAUD|nr:guanylate kinase [Salmonella phage SP1]ASZ77734.1 hypothetical protein [Salmonella phage SP1]QOE32001.1 hypothetical protein ISTP3_orf00194 [Salmonella phage ISTP3]